MIKSIHKIIIFAIERMSPLLVYLYFVITEELDAIVILSFVQLVLALSESGIRNSLGVEKNNKLTIVTINCSLTYIAVLFMAFYYQSSLYVVLLLNFHSLILLGANYKLGKVGFKDFLTVSVLAMANLYAFILAQSDELFSFALILSSLSLNMCLVIFVMRTVLAESGVPKDLYQLKGYIKYSIFSLPMAIIFPLDMYLSTLYMDNFVYYQNTYRLASFLMVGFMIINYYQSVNISRYSYAMFIKKFKYKYLSYCALVISLLVSLNFLFVDLIELPLAISLIVLPLFGPIYQFLIRENVGFSVLYVIFLVALNYTPYFSQNVMQYKFFANVILFFLVFLVAIFLYKNESSCSGRLPT